MDLNMPKDTDKDEELNKAKESGALTILLGKNDNVYYYEGKLEDDASNFKQTTFKGIRDVIINKKQEVKKKHVHNDQCPELIEKAKKKVNPKDPNWETADLDRDFVVVIKPNAEATYKNTVDILDETTINQVKRFAMVKISQTEIDLIKATEGSQ